MRKPYLILLMRSEDPGAVAVSTWNASMAAFSLGLVFQGMLEIYGTTNAKSIVFFIIGSVMAATGLVSYLVKRRGQNRRSHSVREKAYYR